MLKRIKNIIPTFFRRKDVIRNAFQLYLNKGLNAIIPFILIPYYNKIFGVEQYGELIFIQAIATVLLYLTDYGFVVTGTREVSIHSQNNERLSSLVSSIIVVKFFLTVIVFIVLTLVVWLRGLPLSVALLYLLSFMALSLQNFMPNWFFQGMKRNFIITFTNLFSKILLVVLVYFVIDAGSPLWIVPLIDSISYLLFFGVGLYLVFSFFKLRFILPSKELVKSNFSLSRDNFLITLLSWITTGGVLIFTEQFVSDQSFGYFGNFTRIAYYIFASTHQINLTVFPYISERFARSEEEGHNMFKSVSKPYYFFVSMLLIGGLVFGEQFFRILFDKSFNENLSIHLLSFYLMVLWVSLLLVNNFVGLQYFVARKQDFIYRRYYGVNVLICVIGCIALVPKFGIEGASLSVVAGEAVLCILLIRKYFLVREGRSSFSPSN
jgi:PST family polysaccharide transporter